MSQSPQVGQISPDGLFRWDGQDWTPLARGYREPTSWTLPLQRVAAAYLVLASIEQLVTSALFMNVASVEKATRARQPSLPDDQVHTAAQLGVAFGWVTVVVLSLIMVLLAVGSLLRWRWAFWVVLVWLALSSVIGVATGPTALASNLLQVQPKGSIAVGLVFAVAALALLVWFIVALARYGPWAMRKPG
ncbi:MAG TPA: hypothetical protein VKF14_22220 [Candidatus Dormibacteraeota bacterium]|nr:hypothetical protein [Candidatus Dormibacteraeota bacterium]